MDFLLSTLSGGIFEILESILISLFWDGVFTYHYLEFRAKPINESLRYLSISAIDILPSYFIKVTSSNIIDKAYICSSISSEPLEEDSYSNSSSSRSYLDSSKALKINKKKYLIT